MRSSTLTVDSTSQCKVYYSDKYCNSLWSVLIIMSEKDKNKTADD